MFKKSICLAILISFLLAGCVTMPKNEASDWRNRRIIENKPRPVLLFDVTYKNSNSDALYNYGSKQLKKLGPQKNNNNPSETLHKKSLKNKSPKFKKPEKKLTISEVIDQANIRHRREPDDKSYSNAIVKYAFEDNVIFSVFTSIGHITDIKFQRNENLVSVSAGDTINWLIEHVVAGNQAHLLIKPIISGLSTNLTVLTDKRVYWFYLKSWKETYMAGCEFYYPKEIRANKLKAKKERKQKAIDKLSKVENLNFEYEVKSKCKNCILPVSIFDNGEKLFVVMPEEIKHSSLPALFARDDDGNAEMVVYRFTEGHKFIVDSLHPILMLKYAGKDKAIYLVKKGYEPKTMFGSFLNGLFGSQKSSKSNSNQKSVDR